jgi:hypothetical protein
MNRIYTQTEENNALRELVVSLGFEPAKVVAALSNGGNLCEQKALASQFICRDFSKSHFSPAGVEFGHKWLDSLRSSYGKERDQSRCKGCAGDGVVTREMGEFMPEVVCCPSCDGSGRLPASSLSVTGTALPALPPTLRQLNADVAEQVRLFGAACKAIGRGDAVREYVANGSFTAPTPIPAPSDPKDAQ